MRIAVVGSGISGLSAAYLIQRAHQVTLFESDARFGGHTHTVAVPSNDATVSVDTGFIVFNDRTYPLLNRLFAEWGIESQPSNMSLSVSGGDKDFEYSGSGLRGIFAQSSNLLRPSFYRFLNDIMRFYKIARRAGDNISPELGLSEFLSGFGFGDDFYNRYLYPMTAAVWSMKASDAKNFPARLLIQFFSNHGLLDPTNPLRWRVVRGGSNQYVKKVIAGLGDRAILNCPVTQVTRTKDHVAVTAGGRNFDFDEVVFACHSDQSLRILKDPSEEEKNVLSQIPYSENRTVLHTDSKFMPKRRRAWASWNYRIGSHYDAPVTVTYWMNFLQGLNGPTNYFVTLNGNQEIDPAKIIKKIVYHHPQFGPKALTAQAGWESISGVRRTHYCGAYWRNGFHEDGVWSAMRVAHKLGVQW